VPVGQEREQDQLRARPRLPTIARSTSSSKRLAWARRSTSSIRAAPVWNTASRRRRIEMPGALLFVRLGTVRCASGPTHLHRADAPSPLRGAAPDRRWWPAGRGAPKPASRRIGSRRWWQVCGTRQAEGDLPLGAHERGRTRAIDGADDERGFECSTAAEARMRCARRGSRRRARSLRERERRRRGSNAPKTGPMPSITVSSTWRLPPPWQSD